MFKDTPFVRFCETISSLVLPFIVMGLLGQPVVLYVSLVVGFISVVGLVLGNFITNPAFVSAANNIAGLFDVKFIEGYSFLLTACIAKQAGIEEVYEFGTLFAFIWIASAFSVKLKSFKNKTKV